MRIATYNVEWFDRLFDETGRLAEDGDWSARWNITRARQLDALGVVFRALDADAVMIIEAPDAGHAFQDRPALDQFAAHAGLRARRTLMGFANETRQEIALLYDPDVITARHDPQADTVPRFDGTYHLDLDIDARVDKVRWSKPPLEVAVQKCGRDLRLIGVHAKSKYPRGAKSEADKTRRAIANRRKQLAQCIWLRGRIDAHFGANDPLIVMGDVNDGPGLDELEQLFGRSGVDILLGDGPTALFDPNARASAHATTSRFWIEDRDTWLEAMLDYIMVSRDIALTQPRWRIWHPLTDPDIRRDAALREALLTASDHFPVTLDLCD